MLVWRLEDRNHSWGVYTESLGYKGNRWALGLDSEGPEHPSPANDPGLDKWWRNARFADTEPFVCGFISEEQMLYWFPPQGFVEMASEALSGTRRYDYVVKVFEVDGRTVKRGLRQCMFPRNKAKLISTHELIEFAVLELDIAA